MSVSVLQRPAWYVPALLFVLHQLLQYGLDVRIPLADDYLDPLLCFPLLFGALLVERGYLFGTRRLTALETVTGTVVLSLVFEWVFPALKDRFVYDPWDFVAYAVGALYFYFVINPRRPDSPRGR